MALKGKSPEKINKRLKMFVYGAAGSGKTTAAIQFPSPYVIDTERGTENDGYVDLINKSNGAVFKTSDFDEIYAEVRALLSEKHDFKTLVIDPLTTIYDDLLEKSAKAVGTDFGRHYNDANKKMKSLINMLLRLDMNIIVTSHSKNEYGQNLSVIGQTFDCYKKIDYLFDLVFEVKKSGKDRLACIKKSRVESFEDGSIFPFSFDEISKRYGLDSFTKESISQTLASKEQVSRLTELVQLLHIPNEVIDKWFSKAQCDSFEDMPSDVIAKCIEYCEDKIKK